MFVHGVLPCPLCGPAPWVDRLAHDVGLGCSLEVRDLDPQGWSVQREIPGLIDLGVTRAHHIVARAWEAQSPLRRVGPRGKEGELAEQ